MPFQVSPGVNVSEIDLTTVVPAVSSTEGAIAGVFRWGPVLTRSLVDSEVTLANRFGTPSGSNAETFFTAADFLSYGNKLYVTRVVSDDAYNAGTANAQVISVDGALANSDSDFIARWPGALGNSLEVSVCANTDVFSDDFANTVTVTATIGSTDVTLTSESAENGTTVVAGDILRVGNDTIGFQDMHIETKTDNGNGTFTLTMDKKYRLAATSSLTATRKWRHYDRVNAAPAANHFHVVVVDEDGLIGGVAGAVIEVWESLSTTAGTQLDDGTSTYFQEVVNNSSNWIWATGTEDRTFSLAGLTTYTSLVDGADGDSESAISLGDIAKGYDLYVSAEDVDVSLVLQGRAGHGTNDTGVANYIIDNICEVRKDCVAFVSPAKADVVGNSGSITDAVVAFRNSLTASSYGFMDSGYKYRYDKYNDKYRYTPLNGDIAGLAVRTDDTRDPWFSPAGYSRGIIKNVVKIAWNPNKAQRDILYKADINPVITQPGSGTLLFGDKTLLGRPSAFDRLNVRRLFIVLEKAIATAAKTTLFEFNDEFTRAQFKNLIEPFLRDVQGRRGIYDFRVIADGTNNTPEVIDRNEFIGDIYIKPAKSINFIQLNFVAVRTGVEFEEIVGQF